MNVQYDREADAVYLRLSEDTPDGVSELAHGVNLDVTADGHIVGIEVLDASKRLDIKTLLSYVLELDQATLQPA